MRKIRTELMMTAHYFQANAAVLAFDVTRKITYKNLDKWYSPCSEAFALTRTTKLGGHGYSL